MTQVNVTPDNCLPYASSTYQPDAPQTNKAIQFDGSYSYDLDGTVATYQWDWDSNGSYDSTGISPTHAYATNGDHEYTLKVTDNQGGVGYEHGSVTTHTGNHLPQFLSLYISQNAADTNDTVFFNASGYDDDGKIATYQWNWGDGNNSQTSSPAASHVYATPGTYHPIVTLVDDDGGTASSSPGHTYTITVTAAAPSAQVVWTPEEPHPGNTISFTAYGSSPNGPLNQWTWHWGDGTANTVTSVPNASHAYASAGNYSVTRHRARHDQRDRHGARADGRREDELGTARPLRRHAAMRDVGHVDDVRRLDHDRQRQRRHVVPLGLRRRHDGEYRDADHHALLHVGRHVPRDADRDRRGGDLDAGPA